MIIITLKINFKSKHAIHQNTVYHGERKIYGKRPLVFRILRKQFGIKKFEKSGKYLSLILI